jgi:hypothetical protein
VTVSSDDVPGMASGPMLDDAAIEAILRGDDVAPEHRDLAMFAALVRSVADQPAPRPTPALARLLQGEPPTSTVRPQRRRRSRTRAHTRPGGRRPGRVLTKVAGAGVMAKVSLAFTAAAVVGVGAAGALPEPAGSAVRDAIDAISPVDFRNDDDRPPVGPPGPDDPAGTDGSATTRAPGTTAGRAGDGSGEGRTGGSGDHSGDVDTGGSSSRDAQPDGWNDDERDGAPDGQRDDRGDTGDAPDARDSDERTSDDADATDDGVSGSTGADGTEATSSTTEPYTATESDGDEEDWWPWRSRWPASTSSDGETSTTSTTDADRRTSDTQEADRADPSDTWRTRSGDVDGAGDP